jgi:hypothetical protein
MREVSTFSVSNALRNNPSARYATAANGICRFLYGLQQKEVSLEGTLSAMKRREGDLIFLVRFISLFSFQLLFAGLYNK